MKKSIFVLLLILTGLTMCCAISAEGQAMDPTRQDSSSGAGNIWIDQAETLRTAMEYAQREQDTAEPEETEENGQPQFEAGGDAMDPAYLDFLKYLKGFITGSGTEPAEPYKSIGSDIFRKKMEKYDLDDTGYALRDIDGDGTDELLLGDLQYGQLYDVYAVTNGRLAAVLHSGYKNIFTLNTDGTFTENIMVSAFANTCRFYSYENGTLSGQLTLSIDYMTPDGTLNENPSWYLSGRDSAVSMPVSAEDADAIRKSHTPAEIRYTPLLTDPLLMKDAEPVVTAAWENGSSASAEDTAGAVSNPYAPGDMITFGHYEQDNDPANGKEPIEWQVLAAEKDRVLVISRLGLDLKSYNSIHTPVTWETCSLRSWLNGPFYESAFSAEEKSRILLVTNQNPDNAEYGTPGGNPTADRIFLLSIDEANRYFSNDQARRCGKTKSMSAIRDYYYSSSEYVPWVLRSMGLNSYGASAVLDSGTVCSYPDQNGVTWPYAVRPAFWMSLSEAPAGGTGAQTAVKGYPYIGDTVFFGRYEQDNNTSNGAEPIEWKVTAKAVSLADGFPVNENIVLLISTKVLDAMPFNTAGTNSWDSSSLRNWMLRSFFYEAFSGPEQSVIRKAAHKAGPLDTYPDEDTVFILSMDEVKRFLPEQSDRQFPATPYAVSRKVYRGNNGLACWWTRTYYSKGVAYNVWSNGETEHGDKVTAGDGGVLPAVWINLDEWMKLP